MEIKKSSKIPQKYECNKCNYVTGSKKDYEKHLLTRKHVKEINGNNWKSKNPICEICNKQFKTTSGLWKHRKKCGEFTVQIQDSEKVLEEIVSDTSTTITPDMIMSLLTQNQEFKELIIEQQQEMTKLQGQLLEAVKDGKTVHNNNTNCNNTHNKFNLNFFLNEHCKNAMNISEFIDNMVLSVEDLKNTGRLGYIDGITKIFTDKLKELDTHNRPMHCTDLKRETLYIKNNNEWLKESEDKQKMKTAIECVANKNLNNLNHWKEDNPNHTIMDSKEDKEFVEIMTNSLGGMGSDREKNKQKIIKIVLKEVIVDK